MARSTFDNNDIPAMNAQFGNEKDVTKQCLRICKYAAFVIKLLTNRDKVSENIDNYQKRLQSLIPCRDPTDHDRRLHTQEDTSISSDISPRICKIREIIATEGSNQIVVDTSAGYFHIEQAISRGNSAQFVGSITEQQVMKYYSPWPIAKPWFLE